MLTPFNYSRFYSRVKMSAAPEITGAIDNPGETVIDRGIRMMNRIVNAGMIGTIDEWFDYAAALAVGRARAPNSGEYGKWIVRVGLDKIPSPDRSYVVLIYTREKEDYLRAKVYDHWGGDRAHIKDFRARFIQAAMKNDVERLEEASAIPVELQPLTIPDVADLMNRLAIAYGMIRENERAADIVLGVIDRLSLSALEAITAQKEAH
jgi:hypothetical protein